MPGPDSPALRHPYLPVRTPILVAHRGGGLENPENTHRAFEAAHRAGVTWFETDLRATSDGVVTVFHDATLDRTTDAAGTIRELPWSQVRKARVAGSEPVLRIEELFEAFPDAKINLDIKDEHTFEPTLRVLDSLNAWDRICVASFSASRVRRARSIAGYRLATSLTAPEVTRLALGTRKPVWHSGTRRDSTLHPAHHRHAGVAAQVPESLGRGTLVTERFVARAHAAGIQVHVWTVNDEDQAFRLLSRGVDAIITDRPAHLAQRLQLA